jgi:hypothetical protein
MREIHCIGGPLSATSGNWSGDSAHQLRKLSDAGGAVGPLLFDSTQLNWTSAFGKLPKMKGGSASSVLKIFIVLFCAMQKSFASFIASAFNVPLPENPVAA